MAVLPSTGFCAAILGPSAFDTIFKDGVIEVYSGPQPATADAPATGALLARVTADGGPWAPGDPANGLRFARAGRYAMKDPGQNWTLKGLADGAAGWFRLLPNAFDAGQASLDVPRIDGAVGLIGAPGDAQLYLPDTAINSTTSVSVTYWWYAIPPIGA